MVEKVKVYNLLITIYNSHYGAGTVMISYTSGPYDNLEQCQEAGKEAKANYTAQMQSFNYTCVPIYLPKFTA